MTDGPAFRQAVEHYQQAIAIDSTYAPAYAGLAMAYIELGSWWSSLPPGAFHAQARTAALQALRLDSTLAEAHVALGRIKHLFEWDWAGAEQAFRRGIALNPGATWGRRMYVNYLVSMWRFEEAVAIGMQTVERDPLATAAYIPLGWALTQAGRDAEARVHYEKALDLAPDLVGPHLLLAESDVKAGRFDEALDHAAPADSLLGRAGLPFYLGRLGYIYGRANRPADARRILTELDRRAETEYVAPSALAWLYLGLNQKEKALELMERAVERRDVRAVFLNVEWELDPIRDDSRFQRLLERMNFPG